MSTQSDIARAIATYESGDKDGCLSIVNALIPGALSAANFELEVQVRAVDADSEPIIPTHDQAVIHWLQIAKERLEKELGADHIAFVPVLTALESAKGLISTTD